MYRLTFAGFLVRWALSLLLVGITYNPTGYCVFVWLLDFDSWTEPTMPARALTALVFFIIYAVYYNAVMVAIGRVGVTCIALLFAIVLWQLINWRWVDPTSFFAMQIIGILIISTIMTLGMSWSQIQMRMSGQVDLDFNE